MSDVTKQPEDLVESIISGMVEGQDVDTAVAAVMNDQPEVVEFDEGSTPVCVTCKAPLEEVQVETEDGEIPALYCQPCDTGYIPDPDALAEADAEEGELEEAEIDEENPICPTCGEDALDGQVVEDEQGEIPLIVCDACGTGYVPAEE